VNVPVRISTPARVFSRTGKKPADRRITLTHGLLRIPPDRLFSLLEFQFDPGGLAINFLVAGQPELLAGVQGGQFGLQLANS
jgi:hypothetical protein